MTSTRETPGFRGLTHFTPAGAARMVDVSAKAATVREAVARATLKMKPAALAAAAVAGLTVYDMVKAVDRGVALTELRLMEKSGGKSGHWRRRSRASVVRAKPEIRA